MKRNSEFPTSSELGMLLNFFSLPRHEQADLQQLRLCGLTAALEKWEDWVYQHQELLPDTVRELFLPELPARMRAQEPERPPANNREPEEAKCLLCEWEMEHGWRKPEVLDGLEEPNKDVLDKCNISSHQRRC
ncbi:UNVERIFIED_CONTAM: hypothetical protein FKN15_050386 [Acipenser sinensis]